MLMLMALTASGAAGASSSNSITGIIGHPGPSAFIDSARTNRLLRVAMVDCIAWTLLNNSEIQIMRIEPRLREDDLKIAKAAFEPTFYASLMNDVLNSPVPLPLNVYSSTVARVVDAKAGISGKLSTGARYQFDFLSSRNDSTPPVKAVNPVYFAEPMITVTQPLFKGAGFEVNRAEITIAANRRGMSTEGLRATAMDSVARCIIAYNNYCYAREYKSIADASLARFEDLLGINRQRYAKGLISSVDLLETETAVSQRVKSVIAAEALVAKTEDELKLVTNLVNDPELWNAHIEIIGAPAVEIRRTDLTESLTSAFEHRPDYKMKLIELENREVAVKVTRNERYPALDLVGSYGMNGWGSDFGNALETVDPDNSDWTIGIKFSMPWGGAERARYDQKKLEQMRALLELKRLEQHIILDIRERIREVETQRRQMEAAERAKDLEMKNFLAQKERYAAGQTSTHDMLDYQERVETSETEHLKAVVDYQSAMVNLDKAEGLILHKQNIVLEE